ncbi:MAG: hypothetical protein KBG42_08750 [Lachnospiraceae bacterium]|nr:hypothetical protein [Lachnospiraceae bacterium]
MESYYLIDYENVGNNGVKDCSDMTKSDHIHIFYTDNSKNINLDIINNHGSAEFETHKVPSGRESLDKHLGSYLGYLIGKYPNKGVKVYIISKDKGYDALIKFWGNNADIVRKEKVEPIKEKKQPGASKEKANSPKQTPKGSDSKQVKSSSEKTKFNAELQKTLSKLGYGKEDISVITKLAVKHYGSENFKRDVHIELQKNYNDCSDIYNDIKPILSKYC